MENDIFASLVGAVAGAGGLWVVQALMGRKVTGEARHEALRAKLHEHDVRISLLELKTGVRGNTKRR